MYLVGPWHCPVQDTFNSVFSIELRLGSVQCYSLLLYWKPEYMSPSAPDSLYHMCYENSPASEDRVKL